MKKTIIKSGLIAATFSCLMAGVVHAEDVPDMPQEVISTNGAVDIFLPNAEWREVQYADACVAFTDGSDFILFNHYEKGEPVKNVEPGEATELYYEAIQAVNDAKYVFYGYAENQDDFDQIKIAIANAKVDPSKIPVEKHEITADQYSIEANDFIGYSTANDLNIRSEEGMNGPAIGGLGYGDEVHVTGTVLLNSQPCGWYQIDFNGGKGYVSADFITTNKPQPQPDPDPEIHPVLNVGIRRADGTDEGTHFVHEEGGDWVDDYGDAFTSNGDGETWTRQNDGTLWTSGEISQPETDPQPVVNVSIRRADGTDEGTHFVHEEGGGWVDDYGDAFASNGDGETWTRQNDGTLWTSGEVPQPEPEPDPQPVVNVSITRADGTDEGTHFVHEEGGGWVDDCGDAFSDNGDGTWTRQNDGTLWQQ